MESALNLVSVDLVETVDCIDLRSNIVVDDSKNAEIGVMAVSQVEGKVKEKDNIGIDGDHDDRKENQNQLKSPWKKPVNEGKGTEIPVLMGTESWPALAEARIKLQPVVVVAKPADVVTPPPPPPPPRTPSVQAPMRQPKGNGFGSSNPSHKHPSFHNRRTGSKRNNPQNGFPLVQLPVSGPVRVPYQQPPWSPFFHTLIPAPHMPVHEYPYRPYPASFSNVDPHMVNSVFETPMQAFVPPTSCVGGIDATRSFQPPVRGRRDPNMYACNIASRQPGVRFNNAWHHQRAFTPTYGPNNIQQNIGPQAFVRPPPFCGPAPGFISGPRFPGHPPPVFCVPPSVPPNSTRGPAFFISHPGFPVPTSEELLLRDQIVKQIEYYFSDANLQTDTYLLSIMDAEGWVPVSKIANFNRVKGMSKDINFILDAMRSSSNLEELDGKIRRRHEWSKWAPCCGQDTLSSKQQTPEGQIDEKATLSMEKADLTESNANRVPEGLVSLASNSENLENHLTSNKSTLEVACRNSSECNKNNNLLNGETKSCQETRESIQTSDSEPSAAIKISEPVTSYLCVSNKDSTDGHGIKNTGTNGYVSFGCVQRVSQPKSASKSLDMLSGLTEKNLENLSNDFVSEPSGYMGEQ